MPASKRMEQALSDLREGGSFDSFVQTTGSEWRAIAKRILSGTYYSSIELDDVVQVMLFTTWQTIDRHRENGVSLGNYVLWNAISIAIRTVNRARGLRGKAAKCQGSQSDPGPMKLFGELGSEFENHEFWRSPPTSADIVVGAKEKAEFFLASASPRDRVLVMHAIAAGSFDYAAKKLLTDPTMASVMSSLRLSNDIENTKRTIVRAALRTKKKIGDKNGRKTEKDNHSKGNDCRRSANGQGQDRPSSEGISVGSCGRQSDVKTADATTSRRRTRRRRIGVESGSLVQSVGA